MAPAAKGTYTGTIPQAHALLRDTSSKETAVMVDPETFQFLTDLAANNRKVWMDANREARDDALRNFTGIATTLHDYADRFDHSVAQTRIKPKQSYSKFYQDARDRVGRDFYRIDLDIYANAGDPAEDVGYYLHIEPGNCHAGAGLFHPSKDALARVRRRIAEQTQDLHALLAEPDFSGAFPTGLVTRKDPKPLPDGYDPASPAAAYLAMHGFGCRKDLPDAALLDDDIIYTLTDIFRAASPLVRFFE
jgi:uncharacterized protein (TIGR02453 family)